MKEQPNDGHAVTVSVSDGDPEREALAVEGSSASDADKGDPAASEIPLAARLKELVVTMLPIGIYGVGTCGVD